MPMDELTFYVDGLPPIKNEAKSLFSADHSKAQAVIKLLEAARKTTVQEGFQPFIGPIAIEVVLHVPGGNAAADATSYLGGIADVLQDKSHLMIPLDHLGDLRFVALYDNDHQIEEIHYRQENRANAGYHIYVRHLLQGPR